MTRLRIWLRWRMVELTMTLMFWRLRLAGYSAEEAYDTVLLIARRSRLIRAKGGGDPWPHMTEAAPDAKGAPEPKEK